MISHPDVLVSAYDFLATTRPFRGWKLPHSDEVTFRISAANSKYGEYIWDSGRHTIDINGTIAHTMTLLATMGHEMIHLRQVLLGGDPDHDPAFYRMVRIVCKHHGFDPSTF
jgi:hypothetical protein